MEYTERFPMREHVSTSPNLNKLWNNFSCSRSWIREEVAPRIDIYQSRWLLKSTKIKYFLLRIIFFFTLESQLFGGERRDRCLRDVLQLPLSKRDDVADGTLTSGLVSQDHLFIWQDIVRPSRLEGESKKGEHSSEKNHGRERTSAKERARSSRYASRKAKVFTAVSSALRVRHCKLASSDLINKTHTHTRVCAQERANATTITYRAWTHADCRRRRESDSTREETVPCARALLCVCMHTRYACWPFICVDLGRMSILHTRYLEKFI